MYARHMRRQNRLPSAASWLAVLIASTAPAFAAHDSTSASSGNDLTRQLRRERRRRIAAEEARERAVAAAVATKIGVAAAARLALATIPSKNYGP